MSENLALSATTRHMDIRFKYAITYYYNIRDIVCYYEDFYNMVISLSWRQTTLDSNFFLNHREHQGQFLCADPSLRSVS